VGEPCIALVLAAGEGRRMGMPKALLELGGVPLVRLHVDNALALGCTRALVIVRPALASPVEALVASRARVLAAATDSQASSLAVLVRTLAREVRLSVDLTFLVAPVDTWPCCETTHRALQEALSPGIKAATPRFQGRGGHPVLLRAPLLEPYLCGPLEACRPLRAVLAEASRTRVDVADPRVVTDVDTPADAHALGLCVPAAAACSVRQTGH
jgi:CTP:molybdopterin cytidylyltransferase MocA